MTIVTELIDALPYHETIRKVDRNEHLLLKKPEPGAMKLWHDYDMLGVIHFPQNYIPSKFAPPIGVYECDNLRLEFQKMNARQPFYHRNADVDEISYQVTGPRTLMTEIGSVELRPGDFSRIPVGVAHDNYGREEVHLLFYIHAPVKENCPSTKTSKHVVPPFEGWEAKPANEIMTECLGAPGRDIAVSMTDEEMLLNTPIRSKSDEAIQVLQAKEAGPETEWMYKSAHVWIGSTHVKDAEGKTYRRHCRAEEIQYQVSGRRTLVTQRGTVTLEPADFVSIPNGCAFTDVASGESTHITVLSAYRT